MQLFHSFGHLSRAVFKVLTDMSGGNSGTANVTFWSVALFNSLLHNPSQRVICHIIGI